MSIEPPPAGLGRWRGFSAMYGYLRSIGVRRLASAIASARWARVFGPRKGDAFIVDRRTTSARFSAPPEVEHE